MRLPIRRTADELFARLVEGQLEADDRANAAAPRARMPQSRVRLDGSRLRSDNGPNCDAINRHFDQRSTAKA